MDNCINCEHLRKMDDEGNTKSYYCSKHSVTLSYRYTDEEYPLIEKCDECCKDNIPANICGQEVTVDTHDYVLDEVVTDCTVEILKCRKCGEVSIGWKRQGGANASV